MTHATPLRGLRAIALFKAGKSLLVLLAGIGLFTMLHRNVQAEVEAFTQWAHLDPDWRLTQIIVDGAAKVTDDNLFMLAGLAFAYALVHGCEAYGLWTGRAWAEWFTLASGAIYMPAAIHEILRKATWFNVGALLLSIVITSYVGILLYHSRKRRRLARSGSGT